MCVHLFSWIFQVKPEVTEDESWELSTGKNRALCGLERGKDKKLDGDQIVCGRQHAWNGKWWILLPNSCNDRAWTADCVRGLLHITQGHGAKLMMASWSRCEFGENRSAGLILLQQNLELGWRGEIRLNTQSQDMLDRRKRQVQSLALLQVLLIKCWWWVLFSLEQRCNTYEYS